MRLLEGTVYRPGEGWSAGWLAVEGGRVVDEGSGRPPARPDVAGAWVLPAPVNAHTHVGDRVGRGLDLQGLSLADVVRPPHGLKHKLLRDTPRGALVGGMREAVAEMRACGTRGFLDFREQGLDGVAMLREACRDGAPTGVALARCRDAWDDAEADAVARAADGIGLSALGDVSSDVPERASRAARRHGKRFALHFSEDQRDDVGRALDLRPDLLVHVVRATPDDLDAIARAGVPVVLCPRSNARFDRAPDAPAMLARGIPLALGSDNAMFHAMDVLEDARHLAGAHPQGAREVWLDAAIAGGATLLDRTAAPRRSWLRKGDDAALVALAEEPYSPRGLRYLHVELPPGPLQ